MKRPHHLLLAAVLAVALGGCAVLVQFSPDDAAAMDTTLSINALNDMFVNGD